jgi:hypothetical protein
LHQPTDRCHGNAAFYFSRNWNLEVLVRAFKILTQDIMVLLCLEANVEIPPIMQPCRYLLKATNYLCRMCDWTLMGKIRTPRRLSQTATSSRPNVFTVILALSVRREGEAEILLINWCCFAPLRNKVFITSFSLFPWFISPHTLKSQQQVQWFSVWERTFTSLMLVSLIQYAACSSSFTNYLSTNAAWSVCNNYGGREMLFSCFGTTS